MNYAEIPIQYCNYGNETNPIHTASFGYAGFNGDIFCKETKFYKQRPNPSVVNG